jgi:hypothetical protein
LGNLAASAEETLAACNRARDHHALTLLQMADRLADLLHHADPFMAEHEAWNDLLIAMIGMQVRTAYRRAGNSYDRVGRRLDNRIGDGLDPNVARAMEDGRFHCSDASCASGAEWCRCERSDNRTEGVAFAAAANTVVSAGIREGS